MSNKIQNEEEKTVIDGMEGILIDDFSGTFKKCLLYLNKEIGKSTKKIAEQLGDPKLKKGTLDNIKYGYSGKSNISKKQLVNMINTFPDLLLPFLNIKTDAYKASNEMAVMQKEIEYLKERVDKLEEDNKGLYKLIIEKLK